jgi:ubiquinone/menaquinone biosynthesis C-methylase UbiE
MSTEARIASHYTQERLKEKILQAVMETARDPGHLTAGDFAAVDEFHVGGLEATQQLATQMELRPGLRLLDVGSGIGGPARYFAAEHNCKVTGIDLTEEFVEVAKSLTQLVKLDRLAEFQRASAFDLPFEPETFDGAYMIHVGMNIADKAGLCREVRRVLKPGGLFTVFDIMRTGGGAIRYPVPWALTEETSFVAAPEAYRDALEKAGFRIEQERSRKAFAIEFTQRVIARMAQTGPPVLGMQLLMGDKMQAMIANILATMQEGVLEPIELFARAT